MISRMFTPRTCALVSESQSRSDSSATSVSTNPILAFPTALFEPVRPTPSLPHQSLFPPPPVDQVTEPIMGKRTIGLVAGSPEYENIVETNMLFLRSANRALIKVITEINENIEKLHGIDYLGVPPHLLGRPRRRFDPAIAIHKFKNAVSWGDHPVGASTQKVLHALDILQESRNKCGHIDKDKLLDCSNTYLSCIHFLSGPAVLNVPVIMARAKTQLREGKLQLVSM